MPKYERAGSVTVLFSCSGVGPWRAYLGRSLRGSFLWLAAGSLERLVSCMEALGLEPEASEPCSSPSPEPHWSSQALSHL